MFSLSGNSITSSDDWSIFQRKYQNQISKVENTINKFENKTNQLQKTLILTGLIYI